ncbi:BTAD domain-containing putative transcriptional regulator [Streptomyces sp. SudanB66_2053]
MNPAILTHADVVRAQRSQHPAATVLQERSLGISLLGPPRAWRGLEEIHLGSPQQQAVLAALLFRGGRSVTTEELVAAVWTHPPGGATSVVRTYISKLRAVLRSPAGRERGAGSLRSGSGGYTLALPTAAIDVSLMEAELARAREYQDGGRLDDARRLLLRALDRWNGTPLSGVPGPLAEVERERLTELRVSVEVAVLRLDLELGGHQRAVPELLRLTALHPLREEPRHLLMTALYQSGRRADALAVYEETRRILESELAVVPGISLRKLRDRILAGEPRLGVRVALGDTSASATAESSVPLAQLPADLSDFTGRMPETEVLVRALSAGTTETPAVAVVSGMGGVGKTSLALHVAHRLAPAFPDGQLYANFGANSGFTSPLEAVLASLLEALAGPHIAIPRDLAERVTLFRTLMEGRRALLVLDDVWSSEQVRQLLPGSALCAVLVTSRARLGGLPATVRIPMEVPSPEVTKKMFDRMIGRQLPDAEVPTFLRLGELTGHLPLALRILAIKHAAQPGRSFAQTLGGLEDDTSLLEALQVEDLSVQRCIELGYNRLDQEQKQVFVVPAQAGLRDFTAGEIAQILGQDASRIRKALEELVDFGMLEMWTGDRYQYHPLLFLFARSFHTP